MSGALPLLPLYAFVAWKRRLYLSYLFLCLFTTHFKGIIGIFFSKVMTRPGETTVRLYILTHFTCTCCFNCEIYFFFTCAITVGTDVMVSLLEVSYVYFMTLLNVAWALISVWLQGRYIALKLAVSVCSGIKRGYLLSRGNWVRVFPYQRT